MSQGRETGHEAYHGVQATTIQVREVRKYGRGTRTVTVTVSLSVSRMHHKANTDTYKFGRSLLP